jgi:hypothetical protein
VQNAEQGNGTIWSRIQQRLGLKAKDELYKLYGDGTFNEIGITGEHDLDLFVNEVVKNGPRFSHYQPEKLEYFVSRIYELRKNNSNNTTG